MPVNAGINGEGVVFETIAELIARLGVEPPVMSVNLGYNNIGPAGVAAIAEALKVNKTVTRISLSSNYIGNAEATAIAEALKVNETVTSVSLSYNNIGDAGAAAIAEALKVNKTVTSVSLSYNNIGDAGAAAIAEALKVNETVMSVSLDYNHIGGEMLSKITALLTPAAITERRCQITAPEIAEKFAINCNNLVIGVGEGRQIGLTQAELGAACDPRVAQRAMEIFRKQMMKKGISDEAINNFFKNSPDFAMVATIADSKTAVDCYGRPFPTADSKVVVDDEGKYFGVDDKGKYFGVYNKGEMPLGRVRPLLLPMVERPSNPTKKWLQEVAPLWVQYEALGAREGGEEACAHGMQIIIADAIMRQQEKAKERNELREHVRDGGGGGGGAGGENDGYGGGDGGGGRVYGAGAPGSSIIKPDLDKRPFPPPSAPDREHG